MFYASGKGRATPHQNPAEQFTIPAAGRFLLCSLQKVQDTDMRMNKDFKEETL